MNKWVERTIKFVRNESYLDKLLEIYPAEIPPARPLSEADKSILKHLLENQRREDLIIFLFRLKEKKHPFPLEHPYASLLSRIPKSSRYAIIRQNPIIIEKIANILQDMGINKIIEGVERPTDINRIMGQMFRKWIRERLAKQEGFRLVPLSQFKTYSEREITILDISRDQMVTDFIKDEYGKEVAKEFGEKGRDLLANVQGKYVVVEARFLSTPGGSQSRDLDEALSFVRRINNKIALPNLIAAAALDGIMWFYNPYLNKLKALNLNEYALSALLLEDFLKSLR